jgi:hypothetical protein
MLFYDFFVQKQERIPSVVGKGVLVFGEDGVYLCFGDSFTLFFDCTSIEEALDGCVDAVAIDFKFVHCVCRTVLGVFASDVIWETLRFEGVGVFEIFGGVLFED